MQVQNLKFWREALAPAWRGSERRRENDGEKAGREHGEEAGKECR